MLRWHVGAGTLKLWFRRQTTSGVAPALARHGCLVLRFDSRIFAATRGVRRKRNPRSLHLGDDALRLRRPRLSRVSPGHATLPAWPASRRHPRFDTFTLTRVC